MKPELYLYEAGEDPVIHKPEQMRRLTYDEMGQLRRMVLSTWGVELKNCQVIQLQPYTPSIELTLDYFTNSLWLSYDAVNNILVYSARPKTANDFDIAWTKEC